MKVSALRALFEAGLTDEQIMSVLGTGNQEQASQASDPDPQPQQKKSDLQQVLEAITGLTETIQASNISAAKNKDPETVDDILISLIEAD